MLVDHGGEGKADKDCDEGDVSGGGRPACL